MHLRGAHKAGGLLQVFIPDEEVTPSRKQEPFSDWKVSSTPQKTPGTAEAAGRAESGAEASTSASLAFGAGPQAAAQQQSVGQLPQWWDPPPATASTASFKEEVCNGPCLGQPHVSQRLMMITWSCLRIGGLQGRGAPWFQPTSCLGQPQVSQRLMMIFCEDL